MKGHSHTKIMLIISLGTLVILSSLSLNLLNLQSSNSFDQQNDIHQHPLLETQNTEDEKWINPHSRFRTNQSIKSEGFATNLSAMEFYEGQYASWDFNHEYTIGDFPDEEGWSYDFSGTEGNRMMIPEEDGHKYVLMLEDLDDSSGGIIDATWDLRSKIPENYLPWDGEIEFWLKYNTTDGKKANFCLGANGTKPGVHYISFYILDNVLYWNTSSTTGTPVCDISYGWNHYSISYSYFLQSVDIEINGHRVGENLEYMYDDPQVGFPDPDYLVTVKNFSVWTDGPSKDQRIFIDGIVTSNWWAYRKHIGLRQGVMYEGVMNRNEYMGNQTFNIAEKGEEPAEWTCTTTSGSGAFTEVNYYIKGHSNITRMHNGPNNPIMIKDLSGLDIHNCTVSFLIYLEKDTIRDFTFRLSLGENHAGFSIKTRNSGELGQLYSKYYFSTYNYLGDLKLNQWIPITIHYNQTGDDQWELISPAGSFKGNIYNWGAFDADQLEFRPEGNQICEIFLDSVDFSWTEGYYQNRFLAEGEIVEEGVTDSTSRFTDKDTGEELPSQLSYAYYPGTFDFVVNGSNTDPYGWQTQSTGNNEVLTVSNLLGHADVLELRQFDQGTNTVAFMDLGCKMRSGTLEWWNLLQNHNSQNSSKISHIIIEDENDNEIIRLRLNGTKTESWDGVKWTYLGSKITPREWQHIILDFNCSAGKFDLSIAGKEIATQQDMINDNLNITSIKLEIPKTEYNVSFCIDALTHSLDVGYIRGRSSYAIFSSSVIDDEIPYNSQTHEYIYWGNDHYTPNRAQAVNISEYQGHFNISYVQQNGDNKTFKVFKTPKTFDFERKSTFFDLYYNQDERMENHYIQIEKDHVIQAIQWENAVIRESGPVRVTLEFVFNYGRLLLSISPHIITYDLNINDKDIQSSAIRPIVKFLDIVEHDKQAFANLDHETIYKNPSETIFLSEINSLYKWIEYLETGASGFSIPVAWRGQDFQKAESGKIFGLYEKDSRFKWTFGFYDFIDLNYTGSTADDLMGKSLLNHTYYGYYTQWSPSMERGPYFFISPYGNSTATPINATTNLTVHVYDILVDLSTVKYKIDSDSWIFPSSDIFEIDLSTLVEGSHEIYLYANDTNAMTYYETGEPHENLSIFHFVIDRSPPSFSYSGYTNQTWTTSESIINILVEDNNINNDSVRYRWDEGSWVYPSDLESGQNFEFNVPFSALSSGIHDLEIFAEDTAENANITLLEVWIDDLSPEISFDQYVNKTWSQPDTSLWVNITDLQSGVDISSIEYIIDGIPQSAPGDQDFTIDVTTWETGIYTIEVKANDTLDNSAYETFILQIDSSAPKIFFSGYINETWSQSAIELSINTTDVSSGIDISSIQYWINDIPQSDPNKQNFSIDVTGWFDSSYEIRVKVVDNVGNINTSTFLLFIDNSAPEIHFSGYLNNTWQQTSGLLKVNSTDDYSSIDPSSIKYWIDNILQPSPGTDNFTLDISSWSDGTYDILVEVNDSASNSNQSLFKLLIDNQKPNISSTGYDNNTWIRSSDGYIQISVKDIHMDESTVQYKWDDGSWSVPDEDLDATSNVTFELDFSALSEGEHFLYIKGSDLAGNANMTSVCILIDDSGPRFIFSPYSNNSWYEFPTILNINLTDQFNSVEITSIRYWINDIEQSQPSTVNFTIDVSGWLPGEYEFYFSANDTLGNPNSTYFMFGIEDGEYPQISIGGYFNKTWSVYNGSLSIEIDDISPVTTNITIGEFEISSTTDNPIQIDVELWNEGIYLIQVDTMDESGNTNSTVFHFYYDNSAPTILLDINHLENNILSNDSLNASIQTHDINLDNFTVSLYTSTGELIISTEYTAGINYTSGNLVYWDRGPLQNRNTYNFTIVVYDELGNQNLYSVEFTVDVSTDDNGLDLEVIIIIGAIAAVLSIGGGIYLKKRRESSSEPVEERDMDDSKSNILEAHDDDEENGELESNVEKKTNEEEEEPEFFNVEDQEDRIENDSQTETEADMGEKDENNND